VRRDDSLFLGWILPANATHPAMTAPSEIERYVRDVFGHRQGISLGGVTSWETVPIVTLRPDGRLSPVPGRLERFRIEFASGFAVCGIVSPETRDFALRTGRWAGALSEILVRAEAIRDEDSDLAIFEAGDYATVGVLYLSGGLPFASTARPETAEAVPVRDVIAAAYRRDSATD